MRAAGCSGGVGGCSAIGGGIGIACGSAGRGRACSLVPATEGEGGGFTVFTIGGITYPCILIQQQCRCIRRGGAIKGGPATIGSITGVVRELPTAIARNGGNRNPQGITLRITAGDSGNHRRDLYPGGAGILIDRGKTVGSGGRRCIILCSNRHCRSVGCSGGAIIEAIGDGTITGVGVFRAVVILNRLSNRLCGSAGNTRTKGDTQGIAVLHNAVIVGAAAIHQCTNITHTVYTDRGTG